jgi:sugar O-acyltransferase (sialic acid O-acetyltransferase NeuD family)
LKQKLIIVGTGALEVEIREVAEMLGYEISNLDILKNILIIDGQTISLDKVPAKFLNLPVISSIVDYKQFSHLPVFRSWSKNRMQAVRDVEALGFTNWTSIAHPSSVISSSAKIGKNVFISANSTISSNSIIANHTFINRDVSIAHDVNIGNFCFLAPGVTVTGDLSIQDFVFIGAGSIIINNAPIGSGAVVAAGSVVTRSVKDLSFVMGSPARQKNESYRNRRKKLFNLASKYLKKLGLLSFAKSLYSRLR